MAFPTTNLVSKWKLADVSDSVGTNTLTNNNGVSFVAGIDGNCADFEASSSQYLSIVDASQTGLDITSDISISLWFKLESLLSGNEFYFVSKWNGTGDQRAYYLGLYETGGTYTLDFAVSSSGDSATQDFGRLNLSSAPATGVWYNLVTTWKASTSTTIFYLNGVNIGTDTTGSITSIFNSTATFQIGKKQDSADYLDGLLDEVNIWSATLTAQEVSDVYFSYNPLAVSGIVSYWKLDESSGDATDSVGSNTGVNTNVTYAAGKINNGAVFNGTNAKLAVGTTSSLQYTTAVTVSTWFKMTSTATSILFSKDSTALGGYLGYGLYMNIPSTGNIRMRVRTAAGTTFSDLDTTGKSYNDDTWHHVVGTYNAGVQKIYVDGVEVASGGSGSSIYWDTPQIPNLGTSSIGDNWFEGTLDETAIWDRAISSTEITTLYNSGNGLQYPFPTTQAYTLACDTGTFTLTGYAATFSLATTLLAETGNYILRGYDAVLDYVRQSIWTNQSKNSTTWSGTSKNTTEWTDQTKNSTSWTNQNKS